MTDIEDIETTIKPCAPSFKIDDEEEDDEGVVCEKTRVHHDAPTFVWLKTFGCQHNFSDSEFMQGLILDAGMELTDDTNAADVFIINSCTVKNPSQDAFLQTVNKYHKKGAVIAAGCVPQSDDNLPLPSDVSIIGVEQIHRIVEVIHSALANKPLRLLDRSRENMPSLLLPRKRANPFIEPIPISVGCLHTCTYCKTKAARGVLKSYPIPHILESVKRALKFNVQEIRLVSEDTGCYGMDLKSSLPELLNAILNILPPHVMVRLGMANPPYLMKYIDSLGKVFNHPNMFAFAHIPVQSGSDKVLSAMKRGYTQKDFRALVEALRKQVPGISIGTDIICGFPGETDEDFEETLSLLRDLKLPVVNISQMYPRPGTPAAAMKKVSSKIVKERSRACSALFHSYSTLDDLVGKTVTVCGVEMATDGVHVAAHTKEYSQVLLPLSSAPLGSVLEVKVTEKAGKFAVYGEVLRTISVPPAADGFERNEKEKDNEKENDEEEIIQTAKKLKREEMNG